MSDLQAVPGNPQDSPGSIAEATSSDTPTNGEAKRQRRRRGYFRPEEVEVALAISNLAPVGDQIAYNDLPTLEMKLASLFTAKKYRLVERGLLEPDIDIESGKVVSVRIVPEKWEEYADEMVIPEVKPVKATLIGDVVLRKPRNILSDSKFKIKKLKTENPRRLHSHGWHNWEQCYIHFDDASVVDYLNFMKYDRHIEVTSQRGKAYFNGPSLLLLMQDLKAGNIGIYDSTLESNAPGYWLTADDIESRVTSSEEDEDSESSGNPEAGSQGGQTVTPAS